MPAVLFNDPRVQIAYELLCDGQCPDNSAEHWEGWIARRIVGALSATHAPAGERVGVPAPPVDSDAAYRNGRNDGRRDAAKSVRVAWAKHAGKSFDQKFPSTTHECPKCKGFVESIEAIAALSSKPDEG